jgi:hypothetical protein
MDENSRGMDLPGRVGTKGGETIEVRKQQQKRNGGKQTCIRSVESTMMWFPFSKLQNARRVKRSLFGFENS